MRWFKKIVRAFLALLPMFAIFLIPSSASALKHDYPGILWTSGAQPTESCLGSNNQWSDNQFMNGCATWSEDTFSLKFEGDSSSSMPNRLKKSNSYLSYDYDNNSLTYENVYSSFYKSGSLLTFRNYNFISDLVPDIARSTSNSFYFHNGYKFDETYGTTFLPHFDLSSVPYTSLSCNSFSNGAVCDGLWATREYVADSVIPKSTLYSNDGFYVHSSAISSSTGIEYNHSFDLGDLFGLPVNQFSSFNIPLWAKGSYFYTPSNLYSGRSMEWRFTFTFNDGFTLTSKSGSYARLYYTGVTTSGTDVDTYVDCTSITTGYSPDGQDHLSYRLDFSCPVTLSDDLLIMIPSFELNGNGDSFWYTSSGFRFAHSLLVTDNDETPGDDFNSELIGVNIPGDANDLVDGGGADGWFDSLVNLFGFNFINPFAPLFNMFSNNESCASIPNIASMLNSSETQVCPWFDSTTRNIVTPVLGLASAMLVFGFAVRWLGSSSGNMFEDSGHIETPGSGRTGDFVGHHGWRVKK